MKVKLSLLFGSVLFLLVLSACSSTEGSKIEEIYSKSAAASKELQSFSMKMESEQRIDIGGDMSSNDDSSPLAGGIPITSTIDSKMQTEPLAFHQTVETMGQTIEQYYSEGELYMTSPNKEGWFKAPKEVVEQVNKLSASEQTPGTQLESLEKYVSDFDLDENDSTYTLAFEAKGEDVQSLIEESMKEMMPEGQVPQDVLKSLTVNKVSYTFTIDKETYYPQTMDMNMDFTLKEDGKKTTIKQSMEGKYSDFNEVENIAVPEDIVHNAKEIEGMESLFQS